MSVFLNLENARKVRYYQRVRSLDVAVIREYFQYSPQAIHTSICCCHRMLCQFLS